MRRFKQVSVLLVLVLMVYAMGILVNCAGPQTVKPYELGRVTAETLLYDARIMQNKGALTADQFNQVRTVYDQLKVAQDIAISARKAVVDNSKDASPAKVSNAMNNVINLSTQLIKLAQSMGIKGVQ